MHDSIFESHTVVSHYTRARCVFLMVKCLDKCKHLGHPPISSTNCAFTNASILLSVSVQIQGLFFPVGSDL